MKKDKKNSPGNALDLFHPLVRQWFIQRFGAPTEIQANAWPEIAKGHHVLITAPTGSGKTLTAFLWAINNFLVGRQPLETQRVLYISPLKALNNDIRRNLEEPLEGLRQGFEAAGMVLPAIRTAVRSGDTDPSERRRMLRQPPEILITTPESLNVLLTSKNGQKMLTGISTVILDEVHAVLPNKRGTYLITAVERLVPLCGEFQRIALSATVKPLEKAADFIGGYRLIARDGSFEYQKRRVSVIRSDMHKKYHIQVDFASAEEKNQREPREPLPSSEVWWPVLIDRWREIIDQNHSTLFFANSRRMVEKITRLINDSEGERVYSHHGSLSKEIRSVVEKRFKDGELSAIIATSSLELGIDIGYVDEVVLVQSPFSIASAIQRIGRSGHGVGEVSKGRFFPLHSSGLIEAAVIAANIDSEAIETVTPVEAPLDVLAQVLLSMTVSESRNLEELFAETRASYPFHRLSRKEFDLVVRMLAGRYADARIRELKPRLMVDRVKNTAKARDHVPRLLFASGGVIPDRGYYNMRVADTKEKIGELDEEFIWERSLGDAFPFGNQIWRIRRITHNDVEVQQVVKSNSLVPFWRAEEMNRSYHLSKKIGDLLEMADQELGTPGFPGKLREQCHMSETAAKELANFLQRQKKESGAALPHSHHILVEHFQDPVNRSDCKQTVLHTLWGGPVNRPLAFALSAAWEKKYGDPLEVFVNNNCIMLNLPHAFGVSDLLALVPPDRLRPLLRMKLESTAYFGARFRENAQRALLLPRKGFHQRMPLWLNRLRSKKLLESVSQYEDFPILLETWRGCLNQEFEIDILLSLLEAIQTGEIRISEVNTKSPSPFAENVIWRQTNQYMYEDDSPRSKLRTNLSDALLKEVMYSTHLRPRFPGELLRTFQEKLHRVAEGYSPATSDELLQWVKERLYIPVGEWGELLVAVRRDHGLDTGEMVGELRDRLYPIKAGDRLIAMVALENLPRVSHALDIEWEEARRVADRLSLNEVFSEEGEEVLVGFLSEWLRYYGPVSREFVYKSFCGGSGAPRRGEPITMVRCVDKISAMENIPSLTGRPCHGLFSKRAPLAIEMLLEEGRIIIDEFRESSAGEPSCEEICDSGNLEILLRLRRSQARPAIEPLEIRALPLFLAAYQGLVSPGDDLEALQNCLENLFGYPAKAGLWETEILPARLKPYYTSWLDTVIRDNELVWYGCGRERIGFCFESEYEMYYNPSAETAESDESEEEPGEEAEEQKDAEGQPVQPSQSRAAAAELEKLFSESRGKYTLSDIMEMVGYSSGEVTAALWQLAWKGRITNDHFKTLRSGVMNRFKTGQLDKSFLGVQAPRRGEPTMIFQKSPLVAEGIKSTALRREGRRSGVGRGRRRFNLNRWQAARPLTGNWYALPPVESETLDMDALDRQELIKDRIRQLFMRYGILFRELLGNELPGFRWGNIFPVLRLMELSGEILSGHFFKGIPGLQFCTPAALGLLMRGLPGDAIYWIDALDPASPCGIGLEQLKPLYPHRLPSTHLVFHGEKLVLVSKKNGKELIINVEPGHPRLAEYLEFFKTLLGREFQPLKYIGVEIVNDEPVLDSPYREALREFGFKKDYKAMTLMKMY